MKRSFALCLLALILCGIPLFIATGPRDVTASMESISLVSAQETWLRWHEGEPNAWLITTNDDRPRPEKPPMLAWVAMASWIGLSPEQPDPVAMAQRARLATALLALLMLAGVFTIVRTFTDPKRAFITTLIAGTMLLFQKQARIATYDIHMTAWVTVAVALMLSAMRTTDRQTARRWLAWIAAGLATAAAVLSKNPLGLVLVCIPGVIALVMLPDHRRRNMIGVGLALLIGAVLSLPWYIWVAIEFEDIRTALADELRQTRGKDAQPIWYYIALIGLVVPWSIWLISGLIHPWTKNVSQPRTAALFALFWFAAIFIMFSLHPAKQQRYILPIVPAAAMLIAQVFHDHSRPSGVRGDTSVRVLATIHWVALLIASVVACLLVGSQTWIIDRLDALRSAFLTPDATGFIAEAMRGDDWPTEPFLASIGWGWAAAMGGALVAIAVAGYHVHWRWRANQAAVYTALWSIVLFATVWCVYANAPDARLVAHDEADAFLARAGEADLYSLRITEADHVGYKLPHQFRYYVARRIKRITSDDLARLAARTDPLLILSRRRDMDASVLTDAGFTRQWTQETDPRGHKVDVWAPAVSR